LAYKSNTLFYSSPNQTPPPPPYTPCPLQQQQQQQQQQRSFAQPLRPPCRRPQCRQTTIPIGGYQRPAAVAAKHSGRKAPIRRATAPVASVPSPVASSNIPSAGASNGSYNSAPAERTSGYIRRGRIVPIPKADKLRKAPSHGPSCARVCARTPQRSKRSEPASKPVGTHPL
jgi:hypothetical protein